MQLAVDRAGRIVGIAVDDLVAELAQQRARSVNGRPLRLAHACRQRRWNLGAQRNSQPPGFSRGRGDETALRSRRRRRHIQKQRGVLDRPGHRTVDATGRTTRRRAAPAEPGRAAA